MMRRVALLACLVCSPALAQIGGGGFGGYNPSSGSNPAAIADSQVPASDNAVNLGSALKRWAGVYTGLVATGAITAPTASGVVVTGNPTDGAAAVGISLVSSAVANATARIFEVKEGATTIVYADRDGHVLPGTDLTLNLGSSALAWLSVYVQTLRAADGDSRITLAEGSYSLYNSDVAASGAGHHFSNFTSLNPSADAITVYKDSTSTVIAKIKGDGSWHQMAAALQTCGSGTEGMATRDIASGASTGDRTRVCLCSSDGGGTPAYAWVNMGSGNVGTTTTCPN